MARLATATLGRTVRRPDQPLRVSASMTSLDVAR